MSYCAIDFGTSNSAIGTPELVPLEGENRTMPTAVFFHAEEHASASIEFGRAAVAAYTSGEDGRLMRSMKSILGSTLAQQSTDVGGGRQYKYLEIISFYLKHLKAQAEARCGYELSQAVIGRPVYFVDDAPARDAAAQAALLECARAAGFAQVQFQFEPIAAALHYEQSLTQEEIVLVADIGGGTSDFSVVRVGPKRRNRLERSDDVLANHGVHVAGTDFDRSLCLSTVMRELGLGSYGTGDTPREVPSAIYFDLSTWHLVNTVYQSARVFALAQSKRDYAQPHYHERLTRLVQERLGHAMIAKVEQAKIAASAGGAARIDCTQLEACLSIELSAQAAQQALADDVARIVAAAREALRGAGVLPAQLDALYFTGGSTGLGVLTQALQAQFPAARAIKGDAFASVASGLAVYAQTCFGDAQHA